MEKEQLDTPNLDEIKRRFNVTDEYIYKGETPDSPEKNKRFLGYLNSLKRSRKVSEENYEIFKTAFHPNPEMLKEVEVPEPTEEELKEIETVRENIQKMMNPKPVPVPEPELEPKPKRKRKARRTKKQIAEDKEQDKRAKEDKDN